MALIDFVFTRAGEATRITKERATCHRSKQLPRCEL
jgi:hypothetical protein